MVFHKQLERESGLVNKKLGAESWFSYLHALGGAALFLMEKNVANAFATTA